MNDVQKWLNKAPAILTFFLVIALGITLANLLWLVLTPPPAIAEAAVLSSAPKAITAPQQNYGKLIADQHIFGAIPKQAPRATPARKAPKAAPKPVVTKALNFKLHGIVASSEDGNGFAMMSYKGQDQETYRRGEALPKQEADKARVLDGVTLKRVDHTSVVIDNNGTEQVLTLAELSVKTVNKPKTTRPSTPKKPSRPSTSKNNADEKSSDGIETLTELREALLQDSQVITTVITPRLIRKDGQVTGLRVYPGKNRKLFRELGFKNGDVITQVNDVVIDGSPSNLSVLQQFADSPSISINILRGGNEQVLTPSF